MRTAPVSVLLAVLLAALDGVLAAPGARAHDPEAVDVHVAGHSPTQLDASRYDVLEEDVTAPDVVIAGVGTLRGTVSRTEQTKRPIYQYLGIPYAEPPVGDLRFVAPVPRKASDEVIDATKFGPACYQFGSVNLRRKREAIPNMVQSEDCLILDVHTPKVDPTAKLPVLVFVHGGTFLTGSSAIKNPQGLLEEDMILVSPQYRLGPLGFLNLNVDEVPGNAGLLDMIEALKWVNQNIERFGGDPTRVTLGGHSAGAASSSLLYLSPLSEGLIRGVMPMSGSALGFWAYDRDPVPSGKTIAGLAAQVAGCKEDMIQCLRKVTPQQLNYGYAGYALNALKGGALGMSGITPSVQQAPNAKRVFPADPPETILKDGTVKRALPYMTGVTKHEGTWPLDMAETGYIFPNKLESNSSFLRNDLLHVLLRVIGSDDPAGFVSDSVTQAFLDVDTLGDYAAMRDGLIDTAGAFGFKSPAREFVLRNSDLGEPSFLYAFNHNGASTENSKQGISHGADQPYLFPQPGDDVMTGHDLQVALAYRKLVANFVIYQNPTPSENPVARTPTWGPYSRDSESFLELVWPPQAGQGFSSQLTLARVERFSEGVGATTKVATRSTDPDPVTHSTREADSVTSRTSSATALVPLMTALVLPLILAVRGM